MLVEGGGATTLGTFDVIALVVTVTIVAIELPPPPLLFAVQTLLMQSNPLAQSLTPLHVAPVVTESVWGRENREIPRVGSIPPQCSSQRQVVVGLVGAGRVVSHRLLMQSNPSAQSLTVPHVAPA